MIKDKNHLRNIIEDIFDSIYIEDNEKETYYTEDFINHIYKSVIEENKSFEEVMSKFETKDGELENKGRFYKRCNEDFSLTIDYVVFAEIMENIINAFLKDEICYSCYKKNGKYIYEDNILCEKCLEQTITPKLTKITTYQYKDKVYDNVKDTFENFDIKKVKEN